MDQIEGRHLISTSEMLTDKPQVSLVTLATLRLIDLLSNRMCYLF